MKHLLLSVLTAAALHAALSAAPVTVLYDESGLLQPAPARQVISQACSAVVAVDLATAKAEILTNVTDIALKTIDDANDLLTRFSDFAVIDTYAVGLEDARGATSNAANAHIAIVSNPVVVDSGANKLVTLTWQYVEGSFEDPSVLAATTLATNAFETVWTGEPEPISWGETTAYRATVTIPKATHGATAFFKIAAKLRGPVDDGQTFDTYSDGTDYWLDLVPTNRYRLRIISGKITTVQRVLQ